MSNGNERVRVLYSFPLRLGADRICGIAWQQVNGLSAAGAEVTSLPGFDFEAGAAGGEVSLRRWPEGSCACPIKSWARMRACDWHDRVVARRIEKMAERDRYHPHLASGRARNAARGCAAGYSHRAGEVQCAHGFRHGGGAAGVRPPGDHTAAGSRARLQRGEAPQRRG
jgi:hypothetical protein